MEESTEFVEQMEKAAHGGHEHGGHDGPPSGMARHIGITMAILGALLAACSALVGAVRTELIATMVEQTQVSLRNQSQSTKYRMLQAQLQQLHSLLPDPAEFAKLTAELEQLEKQTASADTRLLLRVIRLESQRILTTVTPARDDLKHFARVIRLMEKVKEASKTWTESYEPAILIQTKASARYEWGQLLVELGIVLASVALLFSSRGLWYASMALGLISLTIVIATASTLHTELHHELKRIDQVRRDYDTTVKEMVRTQGLSEREEDERLLKDVETR